MLSPRSALPRASNVRGRSASPTAFFARLRLGSGCDTFGQHYFVSLLVGAIGVVFVGVSLVLP
ncbi:MAG: hypothetical protein MUE69_01635 [Myxococcota bacterium]|nr:hypothetical protein [Myxococcota bacterium]